MQISTGQDFLRTDCQVREYRFAIFFFHYHFFYSIWLMSKVIVNLKHIWLYTHMSIRYPNLIMPKGGFSSGV